MFIKMKRANFVGLWAALLVSSIVTSMFLPGVVQAQPTENVKKAMAMLKAKAKAEKMGPATLKGEASVAGKKVPALYFGKTKMNNNFCAPQKLSQSQFITNIS